MLILFIIYLLYEQIHSVNKNINNVPYFVLFVYNILIIFYKHIKYQKVTSTFTSRNNNTGILLLCDVALGNMNEKLYADYNAAELPPDKHSTKGCGRTAPLETSYTQLEGTQVPIGEGQQIPIQGSLLYNEYIVYDTKQVKMKFLFKIRFDYKF